MDLPPPPPDTQMVAPDEPTVPFDASGSGSVVLIRGFLFQLVIAAGAVVGVLGLSEDSTLVKLIRFARTDEARPILLAVAGVIASGWQLLRGLRRYRGMQVASFFVSERIIKSPRTPPPAVTATVQKLARQTRGNGRTRGL